MSLNQSFISDFSEYYRWSQRTKIKYKLHYGWCTGRRQASGPRQANVVLIGYASSKGSGEPAHQRSLAWTFAARSYKQGVKRNL